MSVEAHLVDTLDCLFDKGWVCRLEPWQDTLLDSLQDITDKRGDIRRHMHRHTVCPHSHLAHTNERAHTHTHTLCTDGAH